LGYGTKITIDTSSKDIYLLLNNVPFTASKGVQFIATGPYNVYIYMTGSSSISLTAGGQYLGGKISGATPNVFVFGDAQQTVALNGCELDAVVYIPLGKMTVSNYALSTCIFFGSSVVKTFNIANDVSIKYVAPVIVGTPLSVLTGGGSDFANWAIEGWDS